MELLLLELCALPRLLGLVGLDVSALRCASRATRGLITPEAAWASLVRLRPMRRRLEWPLLGSIAAASQRFLAVGDSEAVGSLSVLLSMLQEAAEAPARPTAVLCTTLRGREVRPPPSLAPALPAGAERIGLRLVCGEDGLRPIAVVLTGSGAALRPPLLVGRLCVVRDKAAAHYEGLRFDAPPVQECSSMEERLRDAVVCALLRVA